MKKKLLIPLAFFPVFAPLYGAGVESLTPKNQPLFKISNSEMALGIHTTSQAKIISIDEPLPGTLRVHSTSMGRAMLVGQHDPSHITLGMQTTSNSRPLRVSTVRSGSLLDARSPEKVLTYKSETGEEKPGLDTFAFNEGFENILDEYADIFNSTGSPNQFIGKHINPLKVESYDSPTNQATIFNLPKDENLCGKKGFLDKKYRGIHGHNEFEVRFNNLSISITNSELGCDFNGLTKCKSLVKKEDKLICQKQFTNERVEFSLDGIPLEGKLNRIETCHLKGLPIYGAYELEALVSSLANEDKKKFLHSYFEGTHTHNAFIGSCRLEFDLKVESLSDDSLDRNCRVRSMTGDTVENCNFIELNDNGEILCIHNTSIPTDTSVLDTGKDCSSNDYRDSASGRDPLANVLEGVGSHSEIRAREQ